MARYSWKGSLRLSLVTVPVQAINTQAAEHGRIALHQLHNKDHARIRHIKVCPVHGEVSNDEIVSGYEFAKDQYVVIDPAEVEALRANREKAIHLDTFVSSDAIDVLNLAGQHYYLVPDGDAAVKPYVVLQRAMQGLEKYGVGQAVMFGREQLVLIRAYQELLTMSTMNYADTIRSPEEYAPGKTHATAQELKLAETLIKASTAKRFSLASYENQYSRKLRAFIDAKIAGREIVAPPQAEEPSVVNLMDALRRSVAQSHRGSAAQKPARTLKTRKKTIPRTGRAKRA